jgi:hypothetical protein
MDEGIDQSEGNGEETDRSSPLVARPSLAATSIAIRSDGDKLAATTGQGLIV